MKDIIIQSKSIKAHVNAFGAELKGLSRNGTEYLYDGDTEYYDRTSPTLFPIIGRFLSDTYYVGNQAYHMPLNGFAVNRNFFVYRQEEETVIFQLVDDDRTRKLYPFGFELLVEYRIIEKGVQISYIVKNTGNCELPFCLGCHTAYRWPMFEHEDPDDYVLRFEQDEELESFNPFNWREEGFVRGKERTLSHALFCNYTRSITGIKSEWVEFAHRTNGHAVRIHRSEMPYLAIWTLPDEKAEYICLEPCSSVHAGGCTTMYDRNGVIVLQKGETCKRGFWIELL